MGSSSTTEGEGYDRPTIDLPGDQNRLVSQVAAVNPATVVVVNAGAAAGGYDGNVFQANIPYSIAVTYTAGAPGTFVPQASISQFSVGATANTNSKANAAWKSGAAFKIVLTDPSKALVAGTYQDSVTVVLAAGI